MSDMRIQYTEDMVGAGHPTKGDTLNRLALVEADDDGHGLKRYLKAQSTDPSTAAGECALYAKTVGGHVELFHRAESDGAAVQITSGGRLKSAIPSIQVSVWPRTANPAYLGSLGSTNNNLVFAFVDGSTSAVGGKFILPSAAYDYQVAIRLAMSSADAGKAVRLALYAAKIGEGSLVSDPGTWDFSSTVTLGTRSDATVQIAKPASWIIPKATVDNANQGFLLAFMRLGADAADNHTGTMHLDDIWLEAL